MNEAPTTNRALRARVQAIAEHTGPAHIRWCDGSALLAEHRSLVDRLHDSLR